MMEAGTLRMSLLGCAVVFGLGIIAFSLTSVWLFQQQQAARMQLCQERLRGLSDGMTRYYDEHQAFPPGYLPREEANHWGWGAQLLPYLGEEETARRLTENFERGWPAEQGKTLLPVFLCPNDSETRFTGDGLAKSNYVGNHGPEELSFDTAEAGGVLYRNSAVTLDDITDGQQQTILLAERCPVTPEFIETTALWIGVRRDRTPADVLFQGPTGPADTQRLPNRGNGQSISSFHREGINLLFAGGNQRPITPDIDPAVFRSLTTRAGGERPLSQ